MNHSRVLLPLVLALGATALAPACNAVLDNHAGVLVDVDGGAARPSDDGPSDTGDEGARAPSGTGSNSSGGDPDGTGSSGAPPSPGPDAPADAGVDATVDAAPPCPAVCALPHAVSSCVAGQCEVTACDLGFADCDKAPANGCEADLASPGSCGACGVVCPVVPHTQAACVAGACTLTCLVGFADCNAKAEDGCEVNLMKDKRNCGACGTRCLIGKCEEGVCSL